MKGLYELIPQNGRKSFYHKALVRMEDDDSKTLVSYGYDIINEKAGMLTRIYEGNLSKTTSTHLKSFCDINKAAFDKLKVGLATLNPNYNC